MKQRSEVTDSSTDDGVRCTICHSREPSDCTAKMFFWVDCEKCSVWVHSYCVFKNSISRRYTCEMCCQSLQNYLNHLEIEQAAGADAWDGECSPHLQKMTHRSQQHQILSLNLSSQSRLWSALCCLVLVTDFCLLAFSSSALLYFSAFSFSAVLCFLASSPSPCASQFLSLFFLCGLVLPGFLLCLLTSHGFLLFSLSLTLFLSSTRGFTIGEEETCLEELVSHGTVVSLLWEHQGETVREGDTAEKEVSLLSKVVVADELEVDKEKMIFWTEEWMNWRARTKVTYKEWKVVIQLQEQHQD